VSDGPTVFPSDQLLDALEAAVFVFDPHGKILFANRRARRELDDFGELYQRDKLPFASGLEFLDHTGRVLARHELPSVRTIRTGEVMTDFVLCVRSTFHPDPKWFTAATQPLLGDDEQIAGVIVTAFDITGQRDLDLELRASEERFRLIAENAADVVYRFTVGESPRFDYVNPAVEAQLGYRPQDFYDDPGLIVKVTHEDDVDEVLALGYHGVEDVRSLQLRMLRRDGTQIWTEHKLAPLRNANGEVIAATGIARDVTALKVKEAFLSHRALHDPLTGLPNRVLLLDRLESALARIRRHHAHLAVLYLDLDRFKTVNDNLGHETGDRLLQVVGQRLQQTLRPSDSVARLGGDEFAAILNDLHEPGEAMQVAERLLAVISEPIDLGNSPLVTTVSIGIAAADDGDASAGELLRRADFAMYSAKDHGRARVELYVAPEPTTGTPGTADDHDDR
jgi:diguanylate cyclase (GGDEF)-like protein/PAS domain S-box-containing protein